MKARKAEGSFAEERPALVACALSGLFVAVLFLLLVSFAAVVFLLFVSFAAVVFLLFVSY